MKTFLGFSAFEAFICSECGEGKVVQGPAPLALIKEGKQAVKMAILADHESLRAGMRDLFTALGISA